MSSNRSYSYTSSTSYSSSSSTTNPSGTTTSKSYSERVSSDSRTGTHIERKTSETGKPTVVDREFIPPNTGIGSGGVGGNRNRIGGEGEPARIEDVTETEKEYLERMEDEYAKREGGA